MTDDAFDGFWSADDLAETDAREEAERLQESEDAANDDEDPLEDAHGYSRSDLLFGGNW